MGKLISRCRWLAAVAAVALCGACHALYPFEIEPTDQADSGAQIDDQGAVVDGSRDGAPNLEDQGTKPDRIVARDKGTRQEGGAKPDKSVLPPWDAKPGSDKAGPKLDNNVLPPLDIKLKPDKSGPPSDSGPPLDSAWPPDAGQDLAQPQDTGSPPDLPGQPPDAPWPPDAVADLVPQDLDTDPDSPGPPDAAKDQGGMLDTSSKTVPCVNGSEATITSWSSKMVVCKSPTPVTHCAAGSLCNGAGGWHQCSADEYLAHGGLTAGTPVMAWVRSCIRDNGGLVTAPSNKNCAFCDVSKGTTVDVSWGCFAVSYMSSGFNNLGVATVPSCNRLGLNVSSTAGYWLHLPTGNTGLKAAICCQP